MLAFAALPTSASAWLMALLDASAKSVLIFAIAAILALALRRASAALRHLVWTLAIVSALCLPILSILLPARPVLYVPAILGAPASPQSEPLPEENLEARLPPLPATTASSADTAQPPSETRPPAEPAVSALQTPRPSPSVPAQPAGARPPRAIPSILLLIWSLGAAVALLPLLVGMYAVRRLTRRARPFTDPAWLQLLRAGAAQFALRRPLALLRSSPNTVPMMSGLLRPVLLLPAGADAWPPDRRRLVLLHELAHVKRADYLFQILAHLAAAIYWFNPLAWLALHSLRRERERACDDLILNTGFRASDYAHHLLAIARGAQGAGFSSIAAVPMARPTSLEGRVRAILDARRNRRGVTRPAALLAVLAVAAIAIPLARLHALPAPTRLGEGPDGRPLYQWNPSESWPGGSVLDPRLDQPVHFWRAGISLSEVFSSLADQTGVELAFWPEGDENPRVRLNIYLNPNNPPSLRDLMAQLAWVTDCAFAFGEPARGDRGPTYYLLATSVSAAVPLDPGAIQHRAAEREAQALRLKQERNRQEVMANLQELRRALALSRDEAIARYRGADDYLLLTLLEPERRAAAEYVCGILDPADPRLPCNHTWDDLTEERRALLRQALLFQDDWPAKTEVRVEVDYFQPRSYPHAAILLDAFAKTGEDADTGVPHLLGIGIPHFIAPTRDLALRELEDRPITFARLIGEAVPEDQRDAYTEQWKQDIARKRREQPPEGTGAALSSDKKQTLSSLALPLEEGHAYSLWELQQALATASGLNIVSDCFWQPGQTVAQAASALDVLAEHCRASSASAFEANDPAQFAGWEWGDAGSFLRFRSIDRDVWRASLLPPDTIAQLDASLVRYLAELPEQDLPADGIALRVPVDLPELFRIAASLNDLQLAYGGRLTYEDPGDPLAACRQALRTAVLALPTTNRSYSLKRAPHTLHLFRVLASLTAEQWDLARTRGLRQSDLTEAQIAGLLKSHHAYGPEEDDKEIAARDVAQALLWVRGPVPTPGQDRGMPQPRPQQFTVDLVEPKELTVSVIPGKESRDATIFEWECPYTLNVLVPGRAVPLS